MATNQDGYVDLEFNADRTQVFATVYPPKGTGSSVTAKDILDRLRAMGVVYGVRESEVLKAARYADDSSTPATKVLVAQGVLPQDGSDAQILWKVDVAKLSRPLPKREDNLPDYFAYEPERLVTAGQPL